MAPYHGRGEKLLEDLKRFDPDLLMLGWCESRNSDVTLLLRREGFFSSMVFRHDLQIITKNPTVKPDEQQLELVQKLGKHSNHVEVYLMILLFFSSQGADDDQCFPIRQQRDWEDHLGG